MSLRPLGTVLIVDDNPEILGFLTDVLEQERFSVLVASRGERALATVREVPPDVVLMDAIMPGLDGFETCRRLKRMPGCAAIPVIFMTGLSSADHVIQGLEAGGVDYITKPLVPRELVARIRVHLAGARMVASAYAAIEAAGHAFFAVGQNGCLRWATPDAARLLDTVRDNPAVGEALRGLIAQVGSPEPAATDVVSAEIRLVGRIGPDEVLMRIAPSRSSPDEARLRARLPVTPRQAEVLILLTHGKSNRDIAETLGLKPRTVNKHLEQIYGKLGIETRSSAVAVTLRALAT